MRLTYITILSWANHNCRTFGENEDTPTKRINSWKKGYQKGQPGIIITNYHKEYSGLCIEFKSPTNNYQISEAQREMKKKKTVQGKLI